MRHTKRMNTNIDQQSPASYQNEIPQPTEWSEAPKSSSIDDLSEDELVTLARRCEEVALQIEKALYNPTQAPDYREINELSRQLMFDMRALHESDSSLVPPSGWWTLLRVADLNASRIQEGGNLFTARVELLQGTTPQDPSIYLRTAYDTMPDKFLLAFPRDDLLTAINDAPPGNVYHSVRAVNFGVNRLDDEMVPQERAEEVRKRYANTAAIATNFTNETLRRSEIDTVYLVGMGKQALYGPANRLLYSESAATTQELPGVTTSPLPAVQLSQSRKKVA